MQKTTVGMKDILMPRIFNREFMVVINILMIIKG